MCNSPFSMVKRIILEADLKCQCLKMFYKSNCKGRDDRNLYNYFTCQFKLKILCKIKVSSEILLNHTHLFAFSTPWMITCPLGLYTSLLTLLIALFHGLISAELEGWIFRHWKFTCTKLHVQIPVLHFGSILKRTHKIGQSTW